jgi:nucleoid-associated protein YgaU
MLVVGLTVALAVSLGSVAPAAALSCAYLSDPIIAREFNVIYVGIVEEELSRDTDGDDVIRYRMDVRRTLKGFHRTERTMRSYGLDGWSEAREFAVGKRVLVIGGEIGICSPSTTRHVLERADELSMVIARGGWAPAPHVVQSGEYLWSMARKRLTYADGDPTRRQIRIAAEKIYDRNRDVIGSDPDRVRAGMRLMIPRLR